MSEQSKRRQGCFLKAAQREFANAVKDGILSDKCSLVFSRKEPCHHLWIRSNHHDQLESKRCADFFDISLLPLFSKGRNSAPSELIIRVWAQTKKTRESLKQQLGQVDGWKRTAYPRKRNTLDTDPQGAYDYVWDVDWEHLPAEGWRKILDGYKTIENQLIKAGLLAK